jgi:hypothetical protein
MEEDAGPAGEPMDVDEDEEMDQSKTGRGRRFWGGR